MLHCQILAGRPAHGAHHARERDLAELRKIVRALACIDDPELAAAALEDEALAAGGAVDLHVQPRIAAP